MYVSASVINLDCLHFFTLFFNMLYLHSDSTLTPIGHYILEYTYTMGGNNNPSREREIPTQIRQNHNWKP